MKKVVFTFMIVSASVMCFAQDAVQAAGEVAEKTSFLSQVDWGTVINIVLAALAVIFVGAFTFVKNKLRQAGALMIALADAIEDKKIDANERIDLSEKVRALLKK